MEQPQPASSSDGAYHLVFGLAMAAGVVVLAAGIYLAAAGRGMTLLTDGIFAVLMVAVTWPIATGMNGWRRSAEAERAGYVRSLHERMDHMAALLSTMGQQQLLSDRAKAVAYRGKDRQALRDAIREEMNAKDWDAALVLANDMEREFGYAQEAGALRAEINGNRAEVVGRQVAEAVAGVDRHVQAEQWTAAVREAERVMAVHPSDPQVQQLPAAIEARRQGLKRQLRDGFDAAAARHDYDGAMETLRRLDPYLTPAEAAAMQESVRGLLKDRINRFKDQFTRAAHDGNWPEAIRIGEVVITEHPNSRLALEVKDMMDTLRQRAAAQAGQVPQPA